MSSQVSSRVATAGALVCAAGLAGTALTCATNDTSEGPVAGGATGATPTGAGVPGAGVPMGGENGPSGVGASGAGPSGMGAPGGGTPQGSDTPPGAGVPSGGAPGTGAPGTGNPGTAGMGNGTPGGAAGGPGAAAPPRVVIRAPFNDGPDGFTYGDDPVLGTSSPLGAEGAPTDCGLNGGGVNVVLAGPGAAPGLSGGWERSFELPAASALTLSFRYRIERDQEGQTEGRVLVTLDGTPLDVAGDGSVFELTGGGDSGWRLAQLEVPELSAGPHALGLAAYATQASAADRTVVCFDDLLLVRPPPADPAEEATKVVASLDIARFKENIRQLAEFGDREQGSASYTQADQWLQAELEKVGYEVGRQTYTYRGGPRESPFVTKVGSLYPDRMFIISAHLDGRGQGGGADDDASGSSLVLESARALAAVETDASVRFIFWNNEETGLQGSEAYARNRVDRQGIEMPVGSGKYEEPTWLGIIQHDMILFDHGLPPGPRQIPGADVDVEFKQDSVFGAASGALAQLLNQGNKDYSARFPAEVSNNMGFTDSVSFQDFAPSVSVRENQRIAEIGNGANPNWHQRSDVYATYSEDDFELGFNALQMTLGTVAQLVAVRVP